MNALQKSSLFRPSSALTFLSGSGQKKEDPFDSLQHSKGALSAVRGRVGGWKKEYFLVDLSLETLADFLLLVTVFLPWCSLWKIFWDSEVAKMEQNVDSVEEGGGHNGNSGYASSGGNPEEEGSEGWSESEGSRSEHEGSHNTESKEEEGSEVDWYENLLGEPNQQEVFAQMESAQRLFPLKGIFGQGAQPQVGQFNMEADIDSLTLAGPDLSDLLDVLNFEGARVEVHVPSLLLFNSRSRFQVASNTDFRPVSRRLGKTGVPLPLTQFRNIEVCTITLGKIPLTLHMNWHLIVHEADGPRCEQKHELAMVAMHNLVHVGILDDLVPSETRGYRILRDRMRRESLMERREVAPRQKIRLHGESGVEYLKRMWKMMEIVAQGEAALLTGQILRSPPITLAVDIEKAASGAREMWEGRYFVLQAAGFKAAFKNAMQEQVGLFCASNRFVPEGNGTQTWREESFEVMEMGVRMAAKKFSEMVFREGCGFKDRASFVAVDAAIEFHVHESCAGYSLLADGRLAEFHVRQTTLKNKGEEQRVRRSIPEEQYWECAEHFWALDPGDSTGTDDGTTAQDGGVDGARAGRSEDDEGDIEEEECESSSEQEGIGDAGQDNGGVNDTTGRAGRSEDDEGDSKEEECESSGEQEAIGNAGEDDSDVNDTTGRAGRSEDDEGGSEGSSASVNSSASRKRRKMETSLRQRDFQLQRRADPATIELGSLPIEDMELEEIVDLQVDTSELVRRRLHPAADVRDESKQADSTGTVPVLTGCFLADDGHLHPALVSLWRESFYQALDGARPFEVREVNAGGSGSGEDVELDDLPDIPDDSGNETVDNSDYRASANDENYVDGDGREEGRGDVESNDSQDTGAGSGNNKDDYSDLRDSSNDEDNGTIGRLDGNDEDESGDLEELIQLFHAGGGGGGRESGDGEDAELELQTNLLEAHWMEQETEQNEDGAASTNRGHALGDLVHRPLVTYHKLCTTGVVGNAQMKRKITIAFDLDGDGNRVYCVPLRAISKKAAVGSIYMPGIRFGQQTMTRAKKIQECNELPDLIRECLEPLRACAFSSRSGAQRGHVLRDRVRYLVGELRILVASFLDSLEGRNRDIFVRYEHTYVLEQVLKMENAIEVPYDVGVCFPMDFLVVAKTEHIHSALERLASMFMRPLQAFAGVNSPTPLAMYQSIYSRQGGAALIAMCEQALAFVGAKAVMNKGSILKQCLDADGRYFDDHFWAVPPQYWRPLSIEERDATKLVVGVDPDFLGVVPEVEGGEGEEEPMARSATAGWTRKFLKKVRLAKEYADTTERLIVIVQFYAGSHRVETLAHKTQESALRMTDHVASCLIDLYCADMKASLLEWLLRRHPPFGDCLGNFRNLKSELEKVKGVATLNAFVQYLHSHRGFKKWKDPVCLDGTVTETGKLLEFLGGGSQMNLEHWARTPVGKSWKTSPVRHLLMMIANVYSQIPAWTGGGSDVEWSGGKDPFGTMEPLMIRVAHKTVRRAIDGGDVRAFLWHATPSNQFRGERRAWPLALSGDGTLLPSNDGSEVQSTRPRMTRYYAVTRDQFTVGFYGKGDFFRQARAVVDTCMGGIFTVLAENEMEAWEALEESARPSWQKLERDYSLFGDKVSRMNDDPRKKTVTADKVLFALLALAKALEVKRVQVMTGDIVDMGMVQKYFFGDVSDNCYPQMMGCMEVAQSKMNEMKKGFSWRSWKDCNNLEQLKIACGKEWGRLCVEVAWERLRPEMQVYFQSPTQRERKFNVFNVQRKNERGEIVQMYGCMAFHAFETQAHNTSFDGDLLDMMGDTLRVGGIVTKEYLRLFALLREMQQAYLVSCQEAVDAQARKREYRMFREWWNTRMTNDLPKDCPSIEERKRVEIASLENDAVDKDDEEA